MVEMDVWMPDAWESYAAHATEKTMDPSGHYGFLGIRSIDCLAVLGISHFLLVMWEVSEVGM